MIKDPKCECGRGLPDPVCFTREMENAIVEMRKDHRTYYYIATCLTRDFGVQVSADQAQYYHAMLIKDWRRKNGRPVKSAPAKLAKKPAPPIRMPVKAAPVEALPAPPPRNQCATRECKKQRADKYQHCMDHLPKLELTR